MGSGVRVGAFPRPIPAARDARIEFVDASELGIALTDASDRAILIWTRRN
ncbi:MAG: hypothetical protein RQ745_00700 [Longimicrobiales bacterium]|nr:hypothetical protein [Longimicrobiales bacterium]